jgi:threonyl-tRNA synthetase
MLQRIYGTVWATQEELDLYLWRREEARKRDHRRLGVALDLFSFHDVSPGSAFWHPKGQRLWRTLETAMRELQERRGYQEVSTPILVSKRLWEQSGHWDHYADNMFRMESEEQVFSLKPMNCPESTFIYRSRVRSYRELPLRLSEYGRLHRNERSGTLSGLTRVRQFIQDDAHCFVRPDQLADEIEALLGEVRECYSWFGLVPRFAFATRPDKALGDPAAWERAEGLMRSALDASGVDYVVKPRDGTFYAPKIDIYIEDALGREWQMATIQADMMIFPFWCAPVQAVVVPIADRHLEAAGELASVLRARGLRVEVDDSSNRMQNKIRMAQEQKVPYMLVLGDREAEARSASPRTRAGQQLEPMAWEALADRLAGEAAARRPE